MLYSLKVTSLDVLPISIGNGKGTFGFIISFEDNSQFGISEIDDIYHLKELLRLAESDDVDRFNNVLFWVSEPVQDNYLEDASSQSSFYFYDDIIKGILEFDSVSIPVEGKWESDIPLRRASIDSISSEFLEAAANYNYDNDYNSV